VGIEIEELKKKILELVREDEDFAMELNRTILRLYSDKLLTKTYLDEALAKQSKEFDEKLIKLREELSREFDEKLARQSKEFDEKLAKQSKEFDEKLIKLREELSREFDEKLAKQSKEFDEKLAKQSKEFDEKLIKLREELSREFDEKLAKQSKEFDEKLAKQSKQFDEKLAKQSKEFDEKFNKWADNIIERITNKINAIGGRWGIDAENAVRKFAEKIVSDWGGNVKKWNKKVEIKLGDKVIHKEYEIDIVVKDGKELLIEVKASFNKDSMERFVEACELYESSEGKGKKIERIVISFFIYEEAKEIAKKNKVTIITN
jgi:hypothetical protein